MEVHHNLAPYPGFYQLAYVTADLAAAQALFEQTHGIKRTFEMRDIHYETGPGRQAHCDIALAYAGATEIEIIQPLDGDVEFYREFLPQNGEIVRFHHICRMFATNEEYDAEFLKFKALGKHFPVIGNSDVARYFYCDFRKEFGHYIEAIVFSPQARTWLDSIPRF